MTLRDAAEWFRRGQQAMQAGEVDEAIDSLRRATVRDRDDKRYVLGTRCTRSRRKRDHDGARSVLMTLRESAPEDPDINLQLARLAAARQDVTEALRFYHNALYAPWPAEKADARRARSPRADPISAHPRPDQPRALRTARAQPPICRTRPRSISRWRSCSPTPATTPTRWTSFSGRSVWSRQPRGARRRRIGGVQTRRLRRARVRICAAAARRRRGCAPPES